MAGERTIDAGTPESRQMAEGVRRAVRCTERLNALPYDDRERIAAAWSELTGQPVDPTLHLIPPVYSDCGLNLRIGRNVFVNQGCRLDDIGGIELGDDVMLGPGVRIISSGHPLDPALRRRQVTAAPIVVGRNVWIGAGATVLQGVTIGDDAVVAASAVVTHDVPPAVLVAGVPAHIVKSVVDDHRDHRLRAADESDAPGVAELVTAAYQHYVERIGTVPGPMSADYDEVIRNRHVVVAESDGAVVGVVVLGVDDEEFFIDNVAVHPSRRGVGLGRALLELAEAEAERMGFGAVHLYTHEKMTENIALYSRIGYVEYDRRQQGDFSLVYMRKVLDVGDRPGP